MICQRGDFLIFVSVLFLDRPLTGEQIQLGTVETGTEQFVGCTLKILGAMENSNCFRDGAGFLFSRDANVS
jgi:hypothetical protein